MPSRPKRPCQHPGCGVLVNATLCEAHTRTKHRERREQRGSTTERGYGYDWQKLRRVKVATNPICEDCLERGRARLTEEVDHIVPIEKRPDLRLNLDNLRSLCGRCHRAKTALTQRTA